ncbi:MAG: beta-galactosidase [Pseudonocardiaceae bacterium]
MSRFADLEPLPTGRVAVLAEYPYYRADPAAWASNLCALKALGATVITAYVPWRWHELDPEIDGASGYDFTGRTHPQRDVVGFFGIVAETGLKAVLKPGPFIHAEIRLGGLPERLTKLPARRSARGATITDEGEPTPSAHSSEFAAATAEWLRVVRKEVVDVVAYPCGPVIALQLGNEGTFSDLHKPVDMDDFSAAALAAHSRWLGRHAGVPADAAAREKWVRWTGVGTRAVLTSFKEMVGDALPVVVNLPLPGLPGSQRLPEAWLVRAAEAVPSRALAANTSWTGNATFSDEALTALLLGMRFARTDVVEDNWGFTWTDDSYAVPAVPLYHSLLGLALGSSTVSVYTACTTHHWVPHLGPSVEGVLKEGGKPEDFAPPYCPGAPLDESGAMHPNATALRLLTTFTGWFGDVLRSATADVGAHLVVDPVSVAATAWPDPSTEAAPLSVAAAAATRWLLHHGVEVDVARPGDHVLDHARTDNRQRTWLVVGGRAMGQRTQQQLAALITVGHRLVLVGPVPEYDETGAGCDMLAQALWASDTACHVSVGGLGLPAAAERVHEVLAEGQPHNIGTLLVLRRTDPGTNTAIVYFFSRKDREQTVTDRIDGTDVTVSLAPRGVAVLVVVDGELQGFLVNRGTSGDDFSPRLEVGRVGVPASGLVGRRSPSGWEPPPLEGQAGPIMLV